MPTPQANTMTPAERRISVALASLYACRMLGLFLLFPVFAVAVHGLPGGNDPARVGLALGIYGLTQAVMQIPFGLASDRWGRKPVVLAGLLLFIAGSVVCALADDLFWITLGRAIQGAGAISAAITAWLADATRDEVRTRAMALVGMSIGMSFSISLVLAPLVVGWAGLSGLFWLIAVLGVASLLVAAFRVPVVPRQMTPAVQGAVGGVFRHGGLLRLNLGVFVLHLIQVALFVAVPGLLVRYGGLAASELWKVYLPVILVSFVGMVPSIIVAEKRGRQPEMLRLAVLVLVLACAGMALAGAHFAALVAALMVFFVAFNILEALQPSLVSRLAPPELKGLALGIYNTAQALGLFLGGLLGGRLLASSGSAAVFWSCSGLALVWLVLARVPRRVA